MNLLKSLSLSTFNKEITKNTIIHSMKTLLRYHSEMSLKKKTRDPLPLTNCSSLLQNNKNLKLLIGSWKMFSKHLGII